MSIISLYLRLVKRNLKEEAGMKSGIDYKDLKKIIEKEDKDFNVRVKSENFGHRILGWFMSIFNKRYMTGFFTQIGSTLWVPNENFRNDMMSSNISIKSLETLFHELQHIKQKNKDGKVTFSLKYLFPQTITMICIALIAVIGLKMAIFSIFGMALFKAYYSIMLGFLAIAVFPMIPSLMEARSRLKYEMEAYKVSMLIYYFFDFRHSALSYTNFVPTTMTNGDYYWTTDKKTGKKIESELMDFYIKLTEKTDEGKELPEEFEKVWNQLEELTKSNEQ
jgi:hypothetical protein